MADEITSTDRRLIYKIQLSPNGEVFLVEANSATDAHQKGMGLAALENLYWNGMDVNRATENDITDYRGDEEE